MAFTTSASRNQFHVTCSTSITASTMNILHFERVNFETDLGKDMVAYQNSMWGTCTRRRSDGVGSKFILNFTYPIKIFIY